METIMKYIAKDKQSDIKSIDEIYKSGIDDLHNERRKNDDYENIKYEYFQPTLESVAKILEQKYTKMNLDDKDTPVAITLNRKSSIIEEIKDGICSVDTKETLLDSKSKGFNNLSKILREYMNRKDQQVPIQSTYNDPIISWKKISDEINRVLADSKPKHEVSRPNVTYFRNISLKDNLKKIFNPEIIDNGEKTTLIKIDNDFQNDQLTHILNQLLAEKKQLEKNPNSVHFKSHARNNNLSPVTIKNNMTLPPEIMKEIVDNVKSVVIKDLIKEMSVKTTTPYETVTKEPISTSTIHTTEVDKLQKATYIINKLEELFEKIKLFNGSKNADSKLDLKQSIHKNNIANKDDSPIDNNQYAFKNRFDSQIKPTIVKNFVRPQYITYPSLSEITKMETYDTTNKIKSLQMPLTIQTNSNEIPPLRIELFKAPNLLGQNIIVTTQQPISKSNKKQNRTYSNFLSPKNLKDIISKDKDRKSRLYGYSHTTERWVFQQLSNNGVRNLPRNGNKLRFHEKLERYDDFADFSRENIQRNDENKADAIPARQVLPLKYKKTSNYDDKHFRNFLKTQQKVNAMLERILATKTIDGIHSVEGL